MAIFIESYTVSKKEKEDFEEIISQISEEDFNNGFCIDKNRMEYLKIYYEKDKPVGFGMMDRYRETGIGSILNITLGIIPEYRGHGLGRKIGQECINFGMKDKKTVRIYWGANKNNHKSISLAKSLGFVHLSEDNKGYVCYMIDKTKSN